MTPAEKRLQDLVLRRAAGMSNRMAWHLLIAYDLIRDMFTEGELAAAINDGTVDALLASIATATAFSGLGTHVNAQVVAAATRAVERDLPRQFAAGSFDMLNPNVVDAIRQLNTRAVTRLTDDFRATFLQTVEDGLRAGKTPLAIARKVKRGIGLAPHQAQAVANFNAELLTGERKALSRVLARGVIRTPSGELVYRKGHAAGKGLSARDMRILQRKLGEKALTARQIRRMTRDYEKRLIALNVEANARTIALDASRLSQRLSWENAAHFGLVDTEDMTRTWIAVAGPGGDGRNRPHHLALHGTTVGWNQYYPNGELVPGESTYNCRCTELIGA
jgi:hypothetical protein